MESLNLRSEEVEDVHGGPWEVTEDTRNEEAKVEGIEDIGKSYT